MVVHESPRQTIERASAANQVFLNQLPDERQRHLPVVDSHRLDLDRDRPDLGIADFDYLTHRRLLWMPMKTAPGWRAPPAASSGRHARANTHTAVAAASSPRISRTASPPIARSPAPP